MDLTKELNKQQYDVVMATEGAYLVLAGAGSGKTRVLTYRIAHLLIDLDINPYNILAITFTNKATREMLERISSISPYGADVWVSTFHSMCGRMLRRDIDKLGYTSNFSIYTESESKQVINRILKEDNITDESIIKNLKFYISSCKNIGGDIKSYVYGDLKTGKMGIRDDQETVISLYEHYNRELKRANVLDFDDLILKTIELFEKFPDVLSYYSSRFQYIHIDEFQDTNALQFNLVKMLASSYKNIFAVGDEDQSIYGWRGADINNILDFKKTYPNAKIFKLEQNYRSTKAIIEVANRLISNNRQRIGKTLFTENGNNIRVECQYLNRDLDEGEYVAGAIYGLVNHSGYKYSDIAVLIRTNALSRVFEQKFAQYNIPYVVYGGLKFFDRKEIKDILAYLTVIDNPSDDIAFTRVVSYATEKIGLTTIGKLREFAAGINTCMLVAIERINEIAIMRSAKEQFVALYEKIAGFQQKANESKLKEFVDYFLNEVDFLSYYPKDNDEDASRRENVMQFFADINEYAKDNPDNKLCDYLQSVNLQSDIDSDNDEDNNVRIATVHAAKGLEYKAVFVVALEEGSFPLKRALDHPNELEEERRIAYVAVTRARERLYLTYCGSRFKYNKTEYMSKSRFLTEIFGDNQFGVQKQEKKIDSRSTSVASDYMVGSVYSGDTFIAKKQQTSAPIKVFEVSDRVEHISFGEGTVTKVDGDKLTVIFDKVGSKTLSSRIAPLKKL